MILGQDVDNEVFDKPNEAKILAEPTGG